MITNIVKRTFEARRVFNNPELRTRLNENSVTSEYMPSYKWNLQCWRDDGSPLASLSFRTKREALEYAAKQPYQNKVVKSIEAETV